MGAKRYFWLKLMGDFFDKTEIRLIEKAPNGKELVLLYLKLLCRSIESEGYLLFNGRPYSEEIIAMITDTSPEIVKMGISLFEQYGLIERKENTFFMPQIVDMMASETHWAELKRKQRERQTAQEMDNVQGCPNASNECQDNVPLLRDREEIDIKKDIEKDIKPEKKKRKEENSLQIYERLYHDYELSEMLSEKMKNWVTYKMERKEAYKETGIKSLISQVRKQSEQYGDKKVCDLIDECMANGWKGIIWDKLIPKPPTKEELLLDRVNVVDTWV